MLVSPRLHGMVSRLQNAVKAPPPVSVRPLALAVRSLLAGGLFWGLEIRPALGQLPVPSDVFVGMGAVNAPVVTGNTMTINQLTDKAILDWKNFNVGKENTVRFVQPGASSVALNRIHQADPSQILGTLEANGQVYLVNQNGFLFGKDAQINVNSLVATTLNISEESFRLGISQVFDQNRGAALAAVDENGNPVNQLFLKDEQGHPVIDQNGQKVKIQIFVEKGAKIGTNAPDGRVILAAPAIINEGEISAADGQVILAASQDKVYLQQADAGADLRGLLVEVGTGGSVDNLGKIITDRGNASLIGFAVNQQGMVSASTSVKLNGSVRLLAREGIQNPLTTTGALLGASTTRTESLQDGLGTRASVTLGKGSTSSVELSQDKKEKAVDAEKQLKSSIEVSGHQVFLDNESTVRAQSGRVKIAAVDDPVNPGFRGSARVYVENGAKIDVSGVKNVQLPMSRNVLKVELRSNELRDAPLQRDGLLHGKTVSIDVRKVDENGRIPMADVSGALARIQRNIDERSLDGGALTLESTGDVITKAGSVIDFSGGSVAYQGGNVTTTLLTAGNQVFDLSSADPNRRYDGFFGEFSQKSPKWGQTYEWVVPGVRNVHYEAGYVEGKDAGSLDIKTFEAELDGILNGRAVTGPLQRAPDFQPEGGSFALDLNRQTLLSRQDIVFEKGIAHETGLQDPLRRKEDAPDQAHDLFLDPTFFKSSGISRVQIKTNGTINLPESSRLSVIANGRLDLWATGFDVQGRIVAPSGEVGLRPATQLVDGRPEPLDADINLGGRAEILVGGQWQNDRLEPASSGPIALNGGTVTLITEQGDLNLDPGSRIDASGGAWLQQDGGMSVGRGGRISLAADSTILGSAPASLNLGGTLSAWGVDQGGSLSLSSNEIFLGRPSSLSEDSRFPDRNPLILDPEFFKEGGFADYRLTSTYAGLSVLEGVAIRVQQKNRALSKNASTVSSSDNILGVSQAVLKNPEERGAASISLGIQQHLDQNRSARLSVSEGSSIVVDPGGKIDLFADTSIEVNGTLKALGGQIDLTINPPARTDKGYFSAQGIWLGEQSQILASGVFRPESDPSNIKNGEVTAGGVVNLTANRGYVVTQKGSLIDVSGTSETVEIRAPKPGVRGGTVTREKVASSGGTLNVVAGEGLALDGSVSANGGAETAGGGRLNLELNGLRRNKPSEPIANGAFPDDGNTAALRTIIVSAQEGSFLPEDWSLGAGLAAAQFSGKAWLSAPRINGAGFGAISLKTDGFLNNDYTGQIEFRGDVGLSAGRSITLDAPTIAWSEAEGGTEQRVTLNAPYLSLGSTQSRIDALGSGSAARLAPDASLGTGTLEANAQLIDLVGGSSYSGFKRVSLNSEGDIRAIGIRTRSDTKDYLGTMNVAGDLQIKGAQVYPATLSDFKVNVGGSQGPGQLTIQRSSDSTPRAPLTAGGTITLNAERIEQGGVLLAPFGQLQLNAKEQLTLTDQSQTSVSGAGLTVPFGQGSGGLYWLFPLDTTGANNRVISTPVEKQIQLSAENVELQKGSVVDLSGGGNLQAFEFIPGPGGSRDVLAPSDPDAAPKFAVIPGLYTSATPYDPSQFAGAGIQMGDSVYLNKSPGLKAGWYTLLPAHYALLPGAFLISQVPGTRDLLPAQRFSDPSGATIVAGKFGVAGTDLVDSRWQGFAVENTALVRTQAEYKTYTADSFFAAQAEKQGLPAPRLPRDAGSLSIAAESSLALKGSVETTAGKDGLGGQADVSARNLAIMTAAQAASLVQPGFVAVVDEDLNRLNVQSLLLGGRRLQESSGRRLLVSSNEVRLGEGAQLKGSEILLAAKDRVQLGGGSLIEAAGKSEQRSDSFRVSQSTDTGSGSSSDAAIVRVSSLRQGTLIRDRQVNGNQGVIVVESGAELKAGQSMLLDSSRDTLFQGKISMNGGSLALGSSRISLGEASPGTSGLVLRDVNFKVDELRLSGEKGIDLYGGLKLSTDRKSVV